MDNLLAMHRALSFLGLNRGMGSLLLTVLLFELGQRMGERFLPIYLISVGGGAFAIGILNGLNNLLGALYAYPGGYLSDRIGYKKSLLLFDFVAIAGYLLVILITTWWAAIAGAVLFISWSSVSLPAIMSAISRILPLPKQVMGVSLHSFVRRVPMALGPLLGGFLISRLGERDGVRMAFVFSLTLACVAVFVQQKLIPEQAPSPEQVKLPSPFRVLRQMKPGLRRLLVSDILIRFCEQIPYMFVVLFCMKEKGLSALEFGWLTMIEMITAMLVYIPVAALVEKKRSKKPFIAITFMFFSLFPVLLLHANSFWVFAFVFVIRGLKEFGEPTRKALILDLASEGSKATIYGTYYLIRDIIVSIAAFLGTFLWMISPAANLLTATFFGILGVTYFLRYCEE